MWISIPQWSYIHLKKYIAHWRKNTRKGKMKNHHLSLTALWKRRVKSRTIKDPKNNWRARIFPSQQHPSGSTTTAHSHYKADGRTHDQLTRGNRSIFRPDVGVWTEAAPLNPLHLRRSIEVFPLASRRRCRFRHIITLLRRASAKSGHWIRRLQQVESPWRTTPSLAVKTQERMDAPAIELPPRGTKRHAGDMMKSSKKKAMLKLAPTQHQATHDMSSCPMTRPKIHPRTRTRNHCLDLNPVLEA
jgi:hypothetical protein